MQGTTNVTRMDYASPLFNELVFSMATEQLLGIEVPPRAEWIRTMMCELNRISSHMLFQATNGMDVGAVSMMLYGNRLREETLRVLEKITGLRMNHNYIRPGGVAVDLPDGWREDVANLMDMLPPLLDEFDELLTGQPIFRERLQGVGAINTEECLALGVTGPILRGSGYAWDLRRDMPYLKYDELDFDIIVGSYGDCFDRYAVRLAEARESIKIVRQCIEKMPTGDYRLQDKKVTRRLERASMSQWKRSFTTSKSLPRVSRFPRARFYASVESPRGELGCYMVSDGGAHPYRMHIRAPSFVNLQTMPHMMQDALVADVVAIISSVDPVLGEVDR